MVFIVEMFWGRPHYITFYGDNKDGEPVIEKVIKSEGLPDPEWREFSCHNKTWQQAQELGRNFGWPPLGTVPDEISRSNWKTFGRFDADYEPVDWRYIKTIVKEDSAAWGRRLKNCAY